MIINFLNKPLTFIELSMVIGWAIGIGGLLLLAILYIREYFNKRSILGKQLFNDRHTWTVVDVHGEIAAHIVDPTDGKYHHACGVPVDGMRILPNFDDNMVYFFIKAKGAAEYTLARFYPFMRCQIMSRKLKEKVNSSSLLNIGAMFEHSLNVATSVDQVNLNSFYRSEMYGDIIIPDSREDIIYDDDKYIIDGVVDFDIHVHVYPVGTTVDNIKSYPICEHTPFLAVVPENYYTVEKTYVVSYVDGNINVMEIPVYWFTKSILGDLPGKVRDQFYTVMWSKDPGFYRLPIFKSISVY